MTLTPGHYNLLKYTPAPWYLEQYSYSHRSFLIPTTFFNRSPRRTKTLQSTAPLHCEPTTERHRTNCYILFGFQKTRSISYSSPLSVSRRWLPTFLSWTLHSFGSSRPHLSTLNNVFPPIIYSCSRPHLPIDLLFEQEHYEPRHLFTVHPQLSRASTYRDILIDLILHWLAAYSTIYPFLKP